jgi:hypothetical protein
MKTRASDGQRGDGLPAPPAPTARDANPWPMSQGAGGQAREPRHPRAPGRPPRRGSPKLGPAGGKRRIPWIPLLYLFAIAGVVIQFAIQALWRDDVEAAIAAIVMLLFLAFAALRWTRKRKR